MDQLDHTPEVPEQPDEWHLHSVAEGPPQEEHGSSVNTVLLFLAFVGTVGTIVLVTVLTYIYYSTYTNQLRRSRIETTALSEDYVRYRGEWQEMAQDYRWVSLEGEGTVAIPLQVAMERVLERYQQAGGEGGREAPRSQGRGSMEGMGR